MSSEVPLALVFAQLDTPSLLVDATGRIVHVNVAAEQIFARPRDDLLGLPLATLWRSEDQGRVIHAVEEARHSTVDRRIVDAVQLIRGDHDALLVTVALTPLHGLDDPRTLCEVLPILQPPQLLQR
ncbi:MAG: PAS domain-containing protein [Chloroflexi bacterium]|nr:PAS domain-containing protein [Chloroflexota bacterium]MDA1146347.1 PAS domain-containing protein [Chloroflexota bacterium]